jgi:hypothetical protein
LLDEAADSIGAGDASRALVVMMMILAHFGSF